MSDEEKSLGKLFTTCVLTILMHSIYEFIKSFYEFDEEKRIIVNGPKPAESQPQNKSESNIKENIQDDVDEDLVECPSCHKEIRRSSLLHDDNCGFPVCGSCWTGSDDI